MHKTNCMQSIEIFQHGKYLVAYVLKFGVKTFLSGGLQVVKNVIYGV